MAESVGFAVPALVGAALAEARTATLATGLIAAGFVEGGLLGAGQATVLHRVLPRLSVPVFVVATAGAAALAYAIGVIPMLVGGSHLSSLGWPALLALGIPLGGVLLASIGTAQWLLLRRLLPAAKLWILASAAAWLLGLLAFASVSTPLWRPGQPVVIVAAVGILGGVVMAAVVAAVTGAAVLRLVSQLPAAEDDGSVTPAWAGSGHRHGRWRAP
jgi:hypothetical protein